MTPDIRFPSAFDDAEFGETAFDNALPWREIPAARYTPAGTLGPVLPELQRRHDARIRSDKAFKELQDDVAEALRLKAVRSLSLVEAERRKEKDTREARLRSRSTQDAAALRDDGLQSGERSLSAELDSEKALKGRKDTPLDEAVHIVADAATLQTAKQASR
ncbi:MAG: carboxy terminal-processing peptidase [Zoogloea sp.]|nr:carboxy terminal-processing peptidase [Zoogloea sp.]